MRKNWLAFIILTLFLAGCSALPFSFGQQASPTEGVKGLETRPPALDRVQAQLADALAIDPEAVTLQEYREVEWPDACMGLPGPDEVCAQTVTPGYLMLFSTPDGTVEVHSNRAGENFRYGPALSQTGDRPVVAVWQRSGGFAGICQRLILYADGGYLLQDCVKNKALAQGQLSAEVLAQLTEWSGRYQSFQWRAELPPGSADMFNDELTFTGQGSQAATKQQQEDIFNALADTAAELARKAGE